MQIPSSLSLRLRTVLEQLEQVIYDMELEENDDENLLNDNVQAIGCVKQGV